MNPEQILIQKLLAPEIRDNPYNFVMYVYPWGEKGTPLETEKGPHEWQKEYLLDVATHIATQKATLAASGVPEMFKAATASGRGIGKSALIAWLCHWLMSTQFGSTTIVAANNEPQLKSRTFAEITSWLTMAINRHWFESSVLSVVPAPWFEKLLKTQLKIDTGYYYCRGQLWSEENPDGFAGVHNRVGVQVLFDEAAGIPKTIHGVTQGFFTEPTVYRLWHQFSNPRRPSGPFYDLFHADGPTQWRLRQIDARTVATKDPKLYAGIIQDHGADSDEARIEVYGQFPSTGHNQFISTLQVTEAQKRIVEPDTYEPLILGADVARFGDDKTVLRWRQGRDARSIPPIKVQGWGTMEVADLIAMWIIKTRPDAVFIDEGNTGGGVIDALKRLRHRVTGIWFGEASADPRYADKRTEMYAKMRDWMPTGALDGDTVLFKDLTAPGYGPRGNSDRIALESKASMKSRGFKSPDDGDALALTFARPVGRRSSAHGSFGVSRQSMALDIDYPLFG